MNGSVEFYIETVFDPDGLLEAWADGEPDWASLGRHELKSPSAPDTVLMRALGIDLSIFGDVCTAGELMMMDYQSIADFGHAATLTGYVTSGAEQVADILVRYARARNVESDVNEVVGALREGGWPSRVDHVVQTAAFTHHLAKACEWAEREQKSVVWVYRGPQRVYSILQ